MMFMLEESYEHKNPSRKEKKGQCPDDEYESVVKSYECLIVVSWNALCVCTMEMIQTLLHENMQNHYDNDV